MRFNHAGLLYGIVLGICGQTFAMNGFAVSASQAPEDNLGNWPTAGKITHAGVGHIVKYIIQNNAIASYDTIYRQFWGSYCILNVQGNKIAFLRENVNEGTADWKVNARKQYITVMDADGKNARDLDTLNSYDPNCRVEIKIAWPAGDYIYYHYNMRYGYDVNDGTPISQIWRVKCNDPSTQRLVYTYRFIRTFSMSLDGTRAGVTATQGCAGKSAPYCNIPHAFPPTSDPDAGGWAQGVVLGCGSYISPSGKYHWHFWEGGHTVNRIETINMPNQVLATSETNFSTIADWIVAATGMSKSAITGGNMDWGRWAANSDKWFCGSGRNANNVTNGILWSWIDHKAMFIPTSECGALWVAGGPCGSYEDVNGKWVQTSVTGGCGPTEIAQQSARANLTASPLSHNVNVYTVRGTFVGTLDRAKISLKLPAGTYFVAPAARGGARGIVKMHIGGNEARQ
jgi:hypothetical protein